MQKVIINGSWVNITPCFYNNKVVYFIVGNQHAIYNRKNK